MAELLTLIPPIKNVPLRSLDTTDGKAYVGVGARISHNGSSSAEYHRDTDSARYRVW